MTRSGAALTIVSLGVVAAATLWPFTFEPRWVTWADFAAAFGLLPGSMLDFPRNIVLFVSLGIGVATMAGRASGPSRAVLFASVAGLLASATVESLQVFLPGRTPTVADIAANTLGAAIGGLGLLCWRARAGVTLPARPTTPAVSAIASGLYLLLMVLVDWVLMWGVRPQGWEDALRASSENERVGRTSWRGAVSDLVILDRAVEDADTTRLLAGEIPPGRSPVAVVASPRTPDPISNRVLADRINASGQFTLAVTVTTFDLTQEDPAPIVRSSDDLTLGNVSLSQDETHLVLRWRSPLTLANHMEPQLEFPGVFRSLAPQRLVLTFDGALARVRTADEQIGIVLGPEAVFSALLRETNCWPIRVDRFEWWATVVPLPALMFSPFGALWSSVAGVARRRRSRAALLAGALCLPALAVQGFVALYQSRGVRWDIAAISIAFTALGLLGHHLYSTWGSRPEGSPQNGLVIRA